MKNYKGHYIIGASIIIASILISLTLLNKQTSSLEHCYQKVYKNELEKNIKHNKDVEKSAIEKGLPVSIYTNLNASKANAAEYARRRCLKR
jgi:hypothetical protein|tara:strand:+ start:340 stop:612 length:273 start_codon:yes stop_codon:yes gene_type:complete